jgi:hypothetical protein
VVTSTNLFCPHHDHRYYPRRSTQSGDDFGKSDLQSPDLCLSRKWQGGWSYWVRPLIWYEGYERFFLKVSCIHPSLKH